MSLVTQMQRLIELGVPALAGYAVDDFRALASGLADAPGAVLSVHPDLVPAADLAPLLCREGSPGFVVADLTDLAAFAPISGLSVPDRPLYLVRDIERGVEMANWSPAEALPAISDRGRSPLTISEGISWLLQRPDELKRNHCFMTIGSRKPKGAGMDARTPAIWISNGTGRDGAHRRGAPKVGWCWAGNRHTWLGFASATGRQG